jgi:hypothetical protein
LFASLLFCLFFGGIPALGHRYWPTVLEYKEALGLSYVSFVLAWAVIQHNLIYLVVNAVYQVYYHFEFPFIEKYKTNY